MSEGKQSEISYLFFWREREKRKKGRTHVKTNQYLSLLLSLSDSGGEKTAGTGAGSRLADSSIRLSMKSLTWLSN